MTTKTERKDRARRVREVWSWLPAFRAVAETEHLPTAARRHHVTPAALSRSLRLLEESLDRPLFHRVGRGLKITSGGERLAHAVRDAMRLVDDAIADLTAGRLSGPFRLAAPPALSRLLPELAASLRAAHPELILHLVGPRPDAAAALWRGELDLVLSWAPTDDDRLSTRRVAELDTAVFAPPGHDGDLSAPFVALGPRPVLPDPWPAEAPREVALVCDDLRAARAACEGGLLAVLPRALGAGLVAIQETPPLGLFAASRPTLLDGGKAEIVLDALVRATLSARSEI